MSMNAIRSLPVEPIKNSWLVKTRGPGACE